MCVWTAFGALILLATLARIFLRAKPVPLLSAQASVRA